MELWEIKRTVEVIKEQQKTKEYKAQKRKWDREMKKKEKEMDKIAHNNKIWYEKRKEKERQEYEEMLELNPVKAILWKYANQWWDISIYDIDVISEEIYDRLSK